MDKIDRLLQDVLDLQFFVMRYSREGDVDAEERTRERLEVKRHQIADEWRAKDAALEAAYSLVRVAQLEYGIDEPSALAWLKLEAKLQAALSCAKGES